jgi:hypothetical protein
MKTPNERRIEGREKKRRSSVEEEEKREQSV